MRFTLFIASCCINYVRLLIHPPEGVLFVKKVMIVDDVATIRCGIRQGLESGGFTVFEAENGSVALDFIQQNPIDCLVTDLNMPVMDGIQLVERVRKLPGCRFIPVIMLSSEDKAEFYGTAKKNGISTWLAKPFEPSTLTKLVRAMTSF